MPTKTSSQSHACAILRTNSGDHVLQLRVAKNFFTRFLGLMLSKPLMPLQGFLLTRCRSVHTMLMRYAIDVIYLDADGKVVKCVSKVKPWRGSFSTFGRDEQGRSYQRAEHTLEMAAGTIACLGLQIGDRLESVIFGKADQNRPTSSDQVEAAASASQVSGDGKQQKVWRRQRGASMIEFAIVGPMVTLLGLSVLQYGMLFFAKNQINHAAFMAARAGSMGNAQISTVKNAYIKALIPLYGGGENETELAESYAKAQADMATGLQIRLLNPTKESFDDFADEDLKKKYGARAIRNGGLSFRGHSQVGANSGQNVDDANTLKIEVVHGYTPKIPIVSTIYQKYLQETDSGGDSFYTQLVNAGRIPVVTTVTMQMQSDAIEGDNVSSPGQGNGGNPTNPDDPPTDPSDPSNCSSSSCTGSTPPTTPGGGTGSDGSGGDTCTPPSTTSVTLPSDVTFDFDSAALSDSGKSMLDQFIAAAKSDTSITSITITGFTDPIGTESYNRTLSLQRAQAVRDYALSKGLTVPMSVEGLGSSNPKVDIKTCPSDPAQQKNCLAPDRRVEIVATRASSA